MSDSQKTTVLPDSEATRRQPDIKDIINVLATDYNAVYYCNADTHEYDILYQQGFVREELIKMLEACPRFENAFINFIEFLVYPDDRELMRNDLLNVTDKLKNRKSFKTEFRRSYGGKYLYTEMNCVKMGAAEDELHEFVVGFLENDASYRNMMDQRQQLEYMVTERTAELRNRNRTLNKINEDIVELIGNLTEARDVDSGEHIRRVKGFTRILAKQIMNDWPEYGITPDFIELMTSASALHDIGKIMIPDAILLKPGKLTAEEFEIMKTHCDKGCEILKKAPSDWSSSYLKMSFDICRYHHEKYDGRGYPVGLKGDAIPLSAQIVSVADCFDALTTKRVYKDAFSPDTAFSMIINGECGAFSEKILSSFTACRDELFRHASDLSSNVCSSMPAGISTASLSWTKILFVDGNDVSREMGREILEDEGAEVVAVGSGKEAIDVFLDSPTGSFDAILMDVFMPDSDGITAARILRKLDRPDAKTVSIIALTSLASEDDLKACLEAGMDSYITKPISITSLNKVLYECMQSHSEALGSAVEKADHDAYVRMEESLRSVAVFSGLASDYDFIFYVNGNTNDVSGFRGSAVFETLLNSISSQLPSNRRLDQLFRLLVPEQEFASFLENVDRNRIVAYLSDHAMYQTFVPFRIDGEDNLYRLRVVADPDLPGNYVIGVQSVDSETASELRSKELIRKLAESYMIVNYIDFGSDTYSQYHCDKTFASLFPETGRYSDLAASFTARCVSEEDRPTILAWLDSARVREQLNTRKSISIRYRSASEAGMRYREVQFVNAREESDARFAIMTISDIDAIVRKEMENSEKLSIMRKQLVSAELRANRDILTGVKNISAYTDSVASLSEMIRDDPNAEFAVVFCNVNGLKNVNDSYGHETGDMYIRNCCRIICETFKHSPVFRIGGDDFVAILQNSDYERRDELMESLEFKAGNARMISEFKNGKASFEAGIAVYGSTVDLSVADVVNRANINMFSKKHR